MMATRWTETVPLGIPVSECIAGNVKKKGFKRLISMHALYEYNVLWLS